MKSWRTSLLGLVCFVLCILAVADNIRREAWNFRYWHGAIALLAVSLMGFFARDHVVTSEHAGAHTYRALHGAFVLLILLAIIVIGLVVVLNGY